MVEGVLTRFDPKVRIRNSDPSEDAWVPQLVAAAEESHADGIVLPIDVEGYSAERERWGDRVLFSPTVGLSDEEVVERWKRIEELAG